MGRFVALPARGGKVPRTADDLRTRIPWRGTGRAGRDVLTDFTRFVIVPEPTAKPGREYRAVITCTECDWSTETELRTNEVQRLLCGGCGNIEEAYLGIPDEFVGIPCPECFRAVTRLERETNVLGRIELLRLYCPECDWQL